MQIFEPWNHKLSATLIEQFMYSARGYPVETYYISRQWEIVTTVYAYRGNIIFLLPHVLLGSLINVLLRAFHIYFFWTTNNTCCCLITFSSNLATFRYTGWSKERRTICFRCRLVLAFHSWVDQALQIYNGALHSPTTCYCENNS